jgi:hypothetical protein
VDILDVQQGNISGVIAGLDPLALVLSPDETSLYVVTEGQSILRADLATKRILAIGTVPLGVKGLVFNPTPPSSTPRPTPVGP